MMAATHKSLLSQLPFRYLSLFKLEQLQNILNCCEEDRVHD